MAYYVLDDAKNLVESLSKEEILAAITQAVETHQIANVDTGFVTTIKEANAGKGIKIWVGTVAQFNAIAEPESNCIYWFEDDATLTAIQTAIADLQDAQALADAKANQTILNTSVAPATGLSVTLLGTYPISQFAAVKVKTGLDGEVLCNVWNDAGIIYVTGLAPSNGSSSSSPSTVHVNLKITASTNVLTENNSYSATIASSPQVAGVTITRIKGVL